ncbi:MULTISPECIES: DUF397 domain-containing protein [Streptomyces]|uniref:DUF397 domain-containing protein n=1 Tax=Streptomyces spororaveus TaxID=284039 RepID=A0ABQ3TG80_9ACTN|nr:DUF397 domain-containing protein [Streptomyces spororaveus]GHI79399.1 hypothetical protein Sspor_49600 [Streptomyces spororaveus]
MTSTPEYDLSAATWHKSSYSDASGGNCLEVSDGHPDLIPVRDSKQPEGPHVVFHAQAWARFVGSL